MNPYHWCPFIKIDFMIGLLIFRSWSQTNWINTHNTRGQTCVARIYLVDPQLLIPGELLRHEHNQITLLNKENRKRYMDMHQRVAYTFRNINNISVFDQKYTLMPIPIT